MSTAKRQPIRIIRDRADHPPALAEFLAPDDDGSHIPSRPSPIPAGHAVRIGNQEVSRTDCRLTALTIRTLCREQGMPFGTRGHMETIARALEAAAKEDCK